MTKLEVLQNALAAYQCADDEAERKQILQDAIAQFHNTVSTPEETATAITVMMEVVRGRIIKTGYDLDKAEADPTADQEEVKKLKEQHIATLEKLQQDMQQMVKQAARFLPESGEGGAA